MVAHDNRMREMYAAGYFDGPASTGDPSGPTDSGPRPSPAQAAAARAGQLELIVTRVDDPFEKCVLAIALDAVGALPEFGLPAPTKTMAQSLRKEPVLPLSEAEMIAGFVRCATARGIEPNAQGVPLKTLQSRWRKNTPEPVWAVPADIRRPPVTEELVVFRDGSFYRRPPRKVDVDPGRVRLTAGWDEFAHLGALLGIVELASTTIGPDGSTVPHYRTLV